MTMERICDVCDGRSTGAPWFEVSGVLRALARRGDWAISHEGTDPSSILMERKVDVCSWACLARVEEKFGPASQ